MKTILDKITEGMDNRLVYYPDMVEGKNDTEKAYTFLQGVIEDMQYNWDEDAIDDAVIKIAKEIQKYRKTNS